MKTFWIAQQFQYDGSQLKPLFAYLNYKVLGDSVVSWVGPCDISNEEMVDGEDLLEGSLIQGSSMLHFIVEIFHQNLFSGVSMQRLFASICRDYLAEKTGKEIKRDGDDLYWLDGKISISIASISQLSTMIHFAMNITNKGTPVKTAALEDFSLDPQTVALDLMARLQKEYLSIQEATRKVRPLS